jgi:zinc protease
MWHSSETAVLGNKKVYSYIHKQNKLRVLLCPVPGAAVTAYMRAVNAGSKEESATVPMGAAHFIEHMSFRIQKGKIWSLAKKGDVINAETNMDSTRFFVVHLPEQTEETIGIDAARFKENGVPADKVSTEMKAVLNELERGEQIGNKMFRTTSAVSILEHPYHHSTIGTKTSVKSTKAIDMEHFRAKYYVPNNTTLIFVGALNPLKVMEHVSTHFGQMLPGNDCHPVHSQEPPQIGKRIVELKAAAPCPMTCMAFRAPAGSKKESIALKVLSRLLYHRSEGRAAQLIADGTFHDVSTYAPRQMDPYLWFFHGTYEKTSKEIRENMVDKMLETLQSFITHKVSSDKLDQIKNSIADDWKRSTESVQDIMHEMGRSVSMGNWKDFQDKHLQLECLTAEDIQQTAELCFTETGMTVTHVVPDKSTVKTSLPMDIVTREGPVAPPIAELPVAQNASHQWSVNRLTETAHYIHTPRASYVRAIVSARFSPAEHDTASLLVAAMGVQSSGSDSSQQLSKLHSERSFTHDHEFIHMNMEMPNSVHSVTNGAKIMFKKDWLSPNISEESIEMHKHHLIAELESRRSDQNWLVKKNFIGALFEQTQYDIPIEERALRISQTSISDIKDFHRRFVVNNHSTYVMMITPNTETAAALGKVLPAHTTRPQQTLAWASKVRAPSFFKHKLEGYGSAAIMLGQTVPQTMSYKENVALKCAAEILGGGMTGRLMHTVREQRGLGTYGIYAVVQSVSNKSDSIMCVQGTFSPSSLDEGLKVTKELVHDWWNHGVTPKELEDAKDRMIGSLLIASDEVDQLGSIMMRYILQEKNPTEEFNKFKTMARNLTLEDVNNTLKKYIDPSKFAEVIVGPV